MANDKTKQEQLQQASDKWNADLTRLQKYVNESNDDYARFKWEHLFWQEIRMYVSIGEQVTPDDFTWLVERRAFDVPLRDYLKETLCHVGLGTLLAVSSDNAETAT